MANQLTNKFNCQVKYEKHMQNALFRHAPQTLNVHSPGFPNFTVGSDRSNSAPSSMLTTKLSGYLHFKLDNLILVWPPFSSS